MNWEDYFHMDRYTEEEGIHIFEVTLDPACDVYRGHFPGKPISPGVCNIGMIRRCTEKVTGNHLRFTSIKQCRLTGLVTPSATPHLTVEIQISRTDADKTSLRAVIKDSEKSYMDLKGELEDAD